jgi:hypothetical protein
MRKWGLSGSSVAAEEPTSELRQLRAREQQAQKFKTFVHDYLTEHGVPEGDPTNQHQIEGCRIGARLDLLFAREQQIREALEKIDNEPPVTKSASERCNDPECWPCKMWKIAHDALAALALPAAQQQRAPAAEQRESPSAETLNPRGQEKRGDRRRVDSNK